MAFLPVRSPHLPQKSLKKNNLVALPQNIQLLMYLTRSIMKKIEKLQQSFNFLPSFERMSYAAMVNL